MFELNICFSNKDFETCSPTDLKISIIHSPAGDIIIACSILAQHVSIAHVSCDLHGNPVKVDVLPGSFPEFHAAEGSSPASQLPSQVPGVQVAPSLATGRPAAVTVPQRGGITSLQTRAGLTQSPRRQGGAGRSEAEDASTSSTAVAATADVCGDAAIEGGFQGAEQAERDESTDYTDNL